VLPPRARPPAPTVTGLNRGLPHVGELVHRLDHVLRRRNQVGGFMQPENLLPPHGRMLCAACFDGRATWGKSVSSSDDGWTLDNNPCAWGAQNPRFLLLGFSKGERQSSGIVTRPHNNIPYAGFRPRLTAGLQKLGLLHPADTIDAHIRGDEQNWAFGSVVRCRHLEAVSSPAVTPRDDFKLSSCHNEDLPSNP